MKFGGLSWADQEEQQQQQQQPEQPQPPTLFASWPPSITILWPSFDVVARLGSGAFGDVYQIRHRETGQEFAWKALPNHIPSIMAEVGIMYHLSQQKKQNQQQQHDDDDEEEEGEIPMVRLHGLLTRPGPSSSSSLGLVMDLCRGGTLSDFMQQQQHHHPPAGRLTEPQAALVLHTLLRALSHCHRRLVLHRDIKSANVLLLRPSDLSSVRLSDFGLSALLHHPSQRLSDQVGTPGYVAPEVLARDYSFAADVWSLGVLLFEMLGGTLPFSCHQQQNPHQQQPAARRADSLDAELLVGAAADILRFDRPPWPNISSSAKKLVRAMLCKDPTHRPSLHDIALHPWMQTCMAVLQLPQPPTTPPPACKLLRVDPPLPWLRL